MANNSGSNNFSMEQAMAFAASPAGKQLIAMLQNSGLDLSRAQAHAAAGDMEQTKKELSSLLNDPRIQTILKQFGG